MEMKLAGDGATGPGCRAITTRTAIFLITDDRVAGMRHMDAKLNHQGEGYKALLDDLNTPAALSEVHRLARLMHSSEGDEKRRLQAELLGLAELMGLLQQDPEDWFTLARQADDISSDDIEALIAQRTEAKLNKDYAGADAIRQELLDKGVTLEDSREGTKWRRS